MKYLIIVRGQSLETHDSRACDLLEVTLQSWFLLTENMPNTNCCCVKAMIEENGNILLSMSSDCPLLWTFDTTMRYRAQRSKGCDGICEILMKYSSVRMLDEGLVCLCSSSLVCVSVNLQCKYT